MVERHDLMATGTLAARIEPLFWHALAEQPLRQLQSKRPLADARRTDEQERARQPPLRQSAAELFSDTVMTADGLPGHSAVQTAKNLGYRARELTADTAVSQHFGGSG